ncbi:ChbG/HpnK family deacetylase [Deinococcus sp. HMF7620]|uniref:ChbG/HpnK family deacetylase n=1 Tax=Deinococcus arboris TaxID=2682977 RepID=A0A7C9LVH4_9DEIO|nr:polysaccharide deacetylase family protein [Deinococcus arboris]MVN87920.1 ChbG/HpnK family deacetylase [Deinococcus arboris]
MPPNPALLKLGYAPDDRVVIFHADDLGMCQATVDGCADLFRAGMLGSASVMLPCAWAPSALALAHELPGADLGVHLTLTSEWTAARWAPLSGGAGGLTDEAGYLHRTVEAVWAGARPAAVGREIAAQVDRALAWGLPVSHVDSHMGTVAHPALLHRAVRAALARGLLPVLPRLDRAGWHASGLSAPQAAGAALVTRALEARGVPLVDEFVMMPLDEGGDHLPILERMLAALKPGLTHFILHPARDTPELRAVAGDWAGRVANHAAFLDPRLPGILAASGVRVTTYRPLRALLRRRW